MKRKQWKRKKTAGKAVAFLLAAGIAGGLLSAQTVQAGSVEKDDIEAAKKKCQEIMNWRELIKNLPTERPEYKPVYRFWWTNLDLEADRELIVQVYTPNYQEKLLVYDMKEMDEKVEPYLVCETLPPVQIRYDFQEKTDASGKTETIFRAITGLAGGDGAEGVVTFNGDKSDLIYDVRSSFSIAEETKKREEKEQSQSPVDQGADVLGKFDAGKPDEADWGPLNIEHMVDHDFELGRDNFGFTHTNDAEDTRCGFVGISGYEVSEIQKKALLHGEDKGTKAAIKNNLEQEFGGVCYGLANMMGLVKEGALQVKNLDANAKTLYQVGKPGENNMLYQQICYYYLLQHVMEPEDMDAQILFEEINNKSDCAKELETLVKAVSPDRWQILTYVAKSDWLGLKITGHALLVTGMDYVEEADVYRIEFYDMNSLPSVYRKKEEKKEEKKTTETKAKEIETRSKGRFCYMYVKDDFKEFELTDAMGTEVNQENCIDLSLVSVNNIWKEKAEDLKEAEAEKENDKDLQTGNTETKANSKRVDCRDSVVTFEGSRGDLSYQDDNGSQMIYKDGAITEFEKDMKIMPSLIQEGSDSFGKTYRRIQIPDSREMSFQCDPKGVDLSIQNADGYYSVTGQGIEKIVCSQKDGIQLTGEDMTFTTGLLMKESQEHILTKTNGTGSGTITIQETGGRLSISSKKPVTVKWVRAAGDTQTVQYAVDQTAENITLAQDGALTAETDTVSVWMIVVLGCSACGVLVVLLLIRSRKRTIL